MKSVSRNVYDWNCSIPVNIDNKIWIQVHENITHFVYRETQLQQLILIALGTIMDSKTKK
jgi:hypothetical protein